MTDADRSAFYGRRKGKRLRKGQDALLATLLPHLRLPAEGPVDLDRLFAPASLETPANERTVIPGEPKPPGPAFGRPEDKLREGQGRGSKPRRGSGSPSRAAPPPAGDDSGSAEGAGPAVLEIGFGGGEHLAAEARAYPHARFIGCEPFVNGMAKLLATVAREGIGNVRLWDGDATALLPRLPEASLDTVYLLYPDPWPKRRQRKRRFLSDETLSAFARILKTGGELRFATDIDDYAGWALARALRSKDFVWTAERPGDWRRPWPGWPGTRYEAKACVEGRWPSYLTFRRV